MLKQHVAHFLIYLKAHFERIDSNKAANFRRISQNGLPEHLENQFLLLNIGTPYTVMFYEFTALITQHYRVSQSATYIVWILNILLKCEVFMAHPVWSPINTDLFHKFSLLGALWHWLDISVEFCQCFLSSAAFFLQLHAAFERSTDHVGGPSTTVILILES